MDASRLRTGELIAGISAVVLFIVMFLPWYAVGGFAEEALQQAQDLGFTPDVETTANAWRAFGFIDLVLLVTAILAVGVAITAAIAEGPAAAASSPTVAVLGVVSTALILYRIIDPPDLEGLPDVGREFWLYAGLVAAAGIAYGGWRSLPEEGTGLGAA
jgi:hypothetical protein